ncbi:hypothetical protein [Catellatospora citrea]|uniref:hypothetical protein n=1 Tax=Catellatospora citrea TaxID=53366 RepID=UPI001941469C|nr:hypothetical protein [Catellatospora citrea]
MVTQVGVGAAADAISAGVVPVVAQVDAAAGGVPVMTAVPADGRCVLYAFAVTAPSHTRDVLGWDDVQGGGRWLSDPDRVRAEAGALAGTDPFAPGMPDTIEGSGLDAVAEALQEVVRAYLAGHVVLPADVVGQRLHLSREHGLFVDEMPAKDVGGWLGAFGGSVLPDMYGGLPDDAFQVLYRRAHAERGSGPLLEHRQDQLEWINTLAGSWGFPAADLRDGAARDYLKALLDRPDLDRPLDVWERGKVEEAVQAWDWASDAGEFLLPLLAHATGSRIAVWRTEGGVTSSWGEFGPPDGVPVALFHTVSPTAPGSRVKNHYNATMPGAGVGGGHSDVAMAPPGQDAARAPGDATWADVLRWRPTQPGQTFLKYLEQVELGEGEVARLLRDDKVNLNGRGLWETLAGHLMRQWSLRMLNEDKPETDTQYIVEEVAEALGGTAPASSINRWRLEAAAGRMAQSPPEVLDWRPGDGSGAHTLRQRLRQLQNTETMLGRLLKGISLTTDTYQKLDPGVAKWVKQWAMRLNDDPLYAGKKPLVVELSGGMVTRDTLTNWWTKGPEPQVPEAALEALGWRPPTAGQQEPQTFKEQLASLQAARVLPAPTGKRDAATEETVRRWAINMMQEFDPETRTATYTMGQIVNHSGRMFSDTPLRAWWVESSAVLRWQLTAPDELLTWRRVAGGFATLRDYLVAEQAMRAKHVIQEGRKVAMSSTKLKKSSWVGRLLIGVPLFGREVMADAGLERWLQQWVSGLLNEHDPETGLRYSADDVVRLSGGLVDHTMAQQWAASVATMAAAGGHSDVEMAPPGPDAARKPGDVTWSDVLRWEPTQPGQTYLKYLEQVKPGEGEVARRLREEEVDLNAAGRGLSQNVAWHLMRRLSVRMFEQVNPSTGKRYTAEEVAKALNDSTDRNTVTRWRLEAAAGRLAQLPPEVVNWRPGDASKALTLRRRLMQLQQDKGMLGRLLKGIRLTGTHLMLDPGVGKWVKQWAMGLKDNPRYWSNTVLVAELSGDMMSHQTLAKWWDEEPEPQVPAEALEALGWRPPAAGQEGPRTFRARLELLPAGVLTVPPQKLKLDAVTEETVRQWAINMMQEFDPQTQTVTYRIADIVRHSDRLLGEKPLRAWWVEDSAVARLRLTAPDELLTWRRIEGGFATLRDYLFAEQASRAIRVIQDGRKVAVLSSTKLSQPSWLGRLLLGVPLFGLEAVADGGLEQWLQQWATGLLNEHDPRTGLRYSADDLVRLSGGLVDHTMAQQWATRVGLIPGPVVAHAGQGVVQEPADARLYQPDAVHAPADTPQAQPPGTTKPSSDTDGDSVIDDETYSDSDVDMGLDDGSDVDADAGMDVDLESGSVPGGPVVVPGGPVVVPGGAGLSVVRQAVLGPLVQHAESGSGPVLVLPKDMPVYDAFPLYGVGVGRQRVSLAASQALFRQGLHDERLVQDTVFRVGHVEQITTFDSSNPGRVQVRHDYLLVQDQAPPPVQPTAAARLPVPTTLWQQPTLYQILNYDDILHAVPTVNAWVTTLAAATAPAPRLELGLRPTLQVSAHTSNILHTRQVASYVARRLQAALPDVHITTATTPADILTHIDIAPGRANGLVIIHRGPDTHTPPPGHPATSIPGSWAWQNPTNQPTDTGLGLTGPPPSTGPVPQPPAPAGSWALGPHTTEPQHTTPPAVPPADAIGTDPDPVVQRFLDSQLNPHRPDQPNHPTHQAATAPHTTTTGLAWVPQLHTDLTTAQILSHPQTPGIVQLAAGTRARAGNPDTPTTGLRANLTMVRSTAADGTHRLLTADTVFTIGQIDLVTTPGPHTLTTHYDYHLAEARTTPPTNPAHLQPLTPPRPTHPALRHILRSHHPITQTAITTWTQQIATALTDPHTTHQPQLQITAHTPDPAQAHQLAQTAAMELHNFLMQHYPHRPLPHITITTAYPTTAHHQIIVSHNPNPHQVDPRSL